MKHIQKLLFSLSFAALCLSCNDNDTLFEQSEIQTDPSSELVKSVTAHVADFEFDDEDAATRLSHDYSPTTGYTFGWQLGDTIGVYPVESNQVEFPVTDGIGTSKAVFNGGAWALRASYHYAAYFPFSSANYHRKITELPVDYTGQTADANNPLAHLGKYDFIVSAPAETSDQGSVNFDLQHLGCFSRFVLTVPEPGEYTSLTLTCDQVPFPAKATYDLSAATPAIKPTYSFSSYQIALQNVVTTSANEEIVIFAMLPPVNQLEKYVELALSKSDGRLFAATVPGKNMQAGHAYKYQPAVPLAEKSGAMVAQLNGGTSFNLAIKTLAKGSSVTSYDYPDNLVKKIVFQYNSTNKSGTEIPTAKTSSYPVYATFTRSTGEVRITTQASRISLSGSISEMFYKFTALTCIDLTGINTKDVTSMYRMFEGCSALTSLDISGINTQNVTNMERMFYGCSALTSLDLTNFNTQKVTSMDCMFHSCSALTSLDLSGFNTQNVTDMGDMFELCSALTSLDLSGFNTQKVTSMRYMFSGCKALASLDLSDFDTQNVTTMYRMFASCSALTSLNLSGFNTQNVTNMSYMFGYCSDLTSLNLSGFNTQKVTDMSAMFCECSSLTGLDLSGFNTQNVTNMSLLLKKCYRIESLNLGRNFVINSTVNKESMCTDLASIDHKCTISCTAATQSALQTGTGLTESYITWDILN